MRILTAIGDPNINLELKKKGYPIVNTDIQYKEGIIEYLEKNRVDGIVIYDKIEGELDFKELIDTIKPKIKHIFIMLEEEKWIPFLREEKIKYIKKEECFDIKNIIYYFEKIINYKKQKKHKIKNKSISYYKKQEKNYRNIKAKKTIGIFYQNDSDNKEINKLIKNKLILKIIFKIKNKKLIMEINHRETVLKNKKDIARELMMMKIKNKEEQNILIVFKNKELLNEERINKKINKFIYFLNAEIEEIKEGKEWLEKNKKFFKKVEVLFLYHPWKGVDPAIVKHIFFEYPIVKKIKGE